MDFPKKTSTIGVAFMELPRWLGDFRVFFLSESTGNQEKLSGLLWNMNSVKTKHLVGVTGTMEFYDFPLIMGME